MVVVSIIFLLMVFFVFLWIIALFIPTIIELLINLPILYAILMRSYIEVYIEKQYVPYAIGLIAGLLFYIAKQDIFQSFSTPYTLWSPTIFLIVTFLVAQIIILLNNLQTRHNKHG